MSKHARSRPILSVYRNAFARAAIAPPTLHTMTDATSMTQQAIEAFARQDENALSALIPMVYGDLRQVARSIRRSRAGHDDTLATTALVHEAFLRLRNVKAPDLPDKPAFFALAATLMRRAVVDHLRKQNAERRGGGLERVSLQQGLHEAEAGRPQTLLWSLHEALESLQDDSSNLAEHVEMRFFLGMTQAEIAEIRGISERTARREWRLARAWLIDFLA